MKPWGPLNLLFAPYPWRGVWLVLPPSVWALGAFFLLTPWFKGLVAVAMIVAFCVALWLVYLGIRGSRRASLVLALGVVVSLSAGAVRVFWGPPLMAAQDDSPTFSR